jgi:MerR family transcriptional regulator/heat shock protein HspR
MRATRPDDGRGVYGIAVAAELVGMGVQNLRLYEARGLLEPERTEGGTRRYSGNDLDRLRRIGDLLEAGLNLAGIAMVIDLLEQQGPLDPPLTDDEQVWVPGETPVEPVDEADRREQQVPVPAAEDDYPHDRFEAWWP